MNVKKFFYYNTIWFNKKYNRINEISLQMRSFLNKTLFALELFLKRVNQSGGFHISKHVLFVYKRKSEFGIVKHGRTGRTGGL